MAIVELGGNRLLIKILYSIMGDVRNARRIVPADFENFQREENVHTKIFRAIEQGDSLAARQAMEAHFENTQPVLPQRLSRHCEQTAPRLTGTLFCLGSWRKIGQIVLVSCNIP